eukprot:jgi/Hompol1/3158/HPOL_003143-RA
MKPGTETEAAVATQGVRKPVRIWVDGCFDGMHYGHANALRQAKLMGDYLVVGVHSDAEIERNKGPTVMKEDERYAAVAACKWVDEVVPDAPYLTMVEFLDKYECDFCVHGDDVTTMADGSDCYQVVKQAGRYKECKRTEGISTTDLVERMLVLKNNPLLPQSSLDYKVGIQSLCSSDDVFVLLPSFLTTNCLDWRNLTLQRPQAFAVHDTEEKLKIFSNNRKPKPGDRIVYVAGSFDMFHTGHIEFLKVARQQGDYLIAGIYSDETVSRSKRAKYPIMNLHERALSVLACRYVDDIILDAPEAPSIDFLNAHRIDLVCNTTFKNAMPAPEHDIYLEAKTAGKYKEIVNSVPHQSADAIVERILANHLVLVP